METQVKDYYVDVAWMDGKYSTYVVHRWTVFDSCVRLVHSNGQDTVIPLRNVRTFQTREL